MQAVQLNFEVNAYDYQSQFQLQDLCSHCCISARPAVCHQQLYAKGYSQLKLELSPEARFTSGAGKPVAADPGGKEGVEMVSTANDASSGQVKKGSNINPADAPDATWWLRDVNVNVAPGELVCVVGRVGSGKSSLIGALLGT